LLFVCYVCQGEENTTNNGEIILKRSDVVFMAGAELEVYKLYGATVVAWGGGPKDEEEVDKWKERIRQIHEMGIRYICSNAWMLTATCKALAEDPGLRKAVCVNIKGEPIIVPWLWDQTYQGVPTYWCCTNNPRFREHLRNQVILAIKAGADGLHLDDHLGTAATLFSQRPGCLCDFCIKRFRKYLKNRYTPEELKEKGIEEIENFNYREIVSKVTDPSHEKIPLFDEYQTFQLKAAAALVKELGDLAKKLKGKFIPISANAFGLLPHHLVDSHYLDYFVAEVPHYPQEGRTPIYPIFVYKLADALGKPLAATASGWDWAYVKEKNLTTLVKVWIALSYAFGHRFMVPHRQWCFTEEKGTHWYYGPIEEYAPLYQFVRQNAVLFDHYEAVEQVGVLYSNLAFRRGYRAALDICEHLLNTNIPFGLAVAGDDWLLKRLTEEELSRFEMILVPEPIMLKGEQKHLLDKWRAKGKVLSWEDGKEKYVIQHIISTVSLESGRNVLVLPRKIPDKPDTPIVCHILNRDYNASEDKMNRQNNVTIRLSYKLFDGKKLCKAMLFSPESKPTQLSFETRSNGVYITIPELTLWSVIKLDRT